MRTHPDYVSMHQVFAPHLIGKFMFLRVPFEYQALAFDENNIAQVIALFSVVDYLGPFVS
jgi:hypothetical protein